MATHHFTKAEILTEALKLIFGTILALAPIVVILWGVDMRPKPLFLMAQVQALKMGHTLSSFEPIKNSTGLFSAKCKCGSHCFVHLGERVIGGAALGEPCPIREGKP